MFAVLHIADFPLHAVLRSGAFDPGGPAALFDGNGKKSLVTAANAAARATGVVPGLTAPQAVARCAGLAIHAPRPAAEAEARASCAEVLVLPSTMSWKARFTASKGSAPS